MMDVLNSEINKNNTGLQVKDIQSTTFNVDNSVKNRSSFNLGNIQNNIYNVMYDLSQTTDFNKLQTLATHYEDSDFLIKLSEKIQSDFDFCAQVIIAKTEERRPLDTAQRIFLFHSLAAYGIHSESYREAFATVKRELSQILSDAKNQGDSEINHIKSEIELKKSEIELDAGGKTIEINGKISTTKDQLQNVTAIADKNSLQLMIRGFEADLKEIEFKKLQNLNIQNKVLIDKMKDNQAKIGALELEHKKKVQDYTRKLSFIFETKGKNWFPTKTVSRYWANQPSARTDYEFYGDFDLLLHQNPDIMPIARARFFHFLLNNYKDSTQGNIKIKALESLLDVNEEDRQIMKKLFSKEQESSVIKIEDYPTLTSPVTNNTSPKQKVIVTDPAIKSNGSAKVINIKQENESKPTQEEALVTNNLANQLVEASTQKKKSGGQHWESQKIEVKTETKEPLPTVTIFPPKQDPFREVSSAKATVLVSGSADQKKNGVPTTTISEQKYGRDQSSKKGSNRGNNGSRS